ncbi:hypothetical protein NMY22_g8475 [Coprinellus aureogranulatus]|nr:hypothetical protein NMY22_g8475 [Coprinellus aureogranulatus]
MEFGKQLASYPNSSQFPARVASGTECEDEEQEAVASLPDARTDDVLNLNWDLRRPVFCPDRTDILPQYYPGLQDLATKLAPFTGR